MYNCPKCGGELIEEEGFLVCNTCNSKFRVKSYPLSSSNQNNDENAANGSGITDSSAVNNDLTQSKTSSDTSSVDKNEAETQQSIDENCASANNKTDTDVNVSANPSSGARDTMSYMYEKDTLIGNIKYLIAKSKAKKAAANSAGVYNNGGSTATAQGGNMSPKEFWKKWGTKVIIPAILFLILGITLLVLFCGLRGIYVNVDNPNEYYVFTPTSFEYHDVAFGEDYSVEGKYKKSSSTLSLEYTDEDFGSVTSSFSLSASSLNDSFVLKDSFGDKSEYKRVSLTSYIVPQRVKVYITNSSTSADGNYNIEIGERIQEPKTTPTKDGYIFMGWYTSKEGWKNEKATPFDFGDRIWEDTDIYANWKSTAEYTLTGSMLPEEGVTFFEGDNLMRIYQNASGISEKIGDGKVVLEFRDKNGKVVTGAAPPSNVTVRVKEVVIGNNVSVIPNNAFKGCDSLISVTIGDSVTSIGEEAFSGCESLETITVDIGNSVYHSAGNCLIETATKTLIAGCKNSVIPDDGSVTRIGNYAFYDCDSLTSVTIPDSVTSIGSYAFYGCTAKIIWGDNPSITNIGSSAFKGYLGTSISIPASVKSIGESVFYGCTLLTSVTIPNSVTSIGSYAFYKCTSLTSVTLPNSVASIGEYAFYDCSSLTSVNIPYSVMNIGNKAFYNSKNTTTIYIGLPSTPSGWNSSWYYGSGIKIVYDKTVTSSSNNNFNYYVLNDGIYITKYIGSETVVEIPGYIDGKKVLGLDAIFESNTTVTSVTIPDDIITIPYRMFYECTSLTSVTIPDSVTSIGDYAFYRCKSLTSVTIPDGVTSIGDYAFYNCASLTSVTIPDSVTSIGNYAFRGCTSLSSITIGNSVTSIGDYAFTYCNSLTSVTIPDSVTSVGDYVFYNCPLLTSVTIGDSVAMIGWHTFEGCTALTSIAIPDSVTSIGIYAFSGRSSLTSVTIPDSVTSIGDYAFYGCTSLTSVTIPDSVTSIGGYAFSGCTSLTSVTIPDSVTSIGYSAFRSCTSLVSVTIGDSVTSIGSSAFGGCTALKSFTIPDSVTSIGDYAFSGCTSLTSITIPDSVKSIGESAFRECTSLTSVTIGSGVTRIEEYAFYGCYSLDDVYYTSDIASWLKIEFIGQRFSGCNPLYYGAKLYLNGKLATNIVIPDGVTGIKDYSFSGCTSLASVTISDSVKRIGEGAFYSCKSLTSVTIGDSVTSIESYAFQGFTSLTSVTIPDGVTRIGNQAFSGCTSLTSVTFEGTVSQWNSISKGDFWNADTPFTEVICSDGTVSVS